MNSDVQPVSKFLSALFEGLKKNNLLYSVLRNHESLPYDLGGSDLDLAVNEDQRDDVSKYIISLAAEFNGELIVDYTSSGRFMRFLGFYNNCWWGIVIDLFWRIEYKGVGYISCDKIIKRSVEYRSIVVANESDGAIVGLVKELLANGKPKKNQVEKIALVKQGQALLPNPLLDGCFSKNTQLALMEYINDRGAHNRSLSKLVRKLRCEVAQQENDLKRFNKAKNIYYRSRRVLFPPGISVAFLGTDGSGKSTLINIIKPIVENALHSKVQYEHSRPNWLPALGVATGYRKPMDGTPVLNPHGKKPSGRIGSAIRLLYYSLDYTVGYWLRVFPHLVKRPHVTIFDRYYFDLIIDPKRMRIALPRWCAKLAFIFAPKPRIIFCLGSSPEKIFARKPETSLDEVKRQISDLKDICLKEERAVWIDTGGTIEKSRDQILHALVTNMKSRYW